MIRINKLPVDTQVSPELPEALGSQLKPLAEVSIFSTSLAGTGQIFNFTELENSFIQFPQLNKQQVSWSPSEPAPRNSGES